jgi:hypothetical protein
LPLLALHCGEVTSGAAPTASEVVVEVEGLLVDPSPTPTSTAASTELKRAIRGDVAEEILSHAAGVDGAVEGDTFLRPDNEHAPRLGLHGNARIDGERVIIASSTEREIVHGYYDISKTAEPYEGIHGVHAPGRSLCDQRQEALQTRFTGDL